MTCCFLILLQLKTFSMPRCHILGQHVLWTPLIAHESGIMQCLSFYDWLIPPGVMSSRFTHIVAYILRISFHFKTNSPFCVAFYTHTHTNIYTYTHICVYTCTYINGIFFSHSLISGHLDCFHILSIVFGRYFWLI